MSVAPEADKLKSWIDTYQPKIYRAACLILRDRGAAEDVAQETFIRAFTAKRRVEADTEIGPWLNRICINLCLNRIRSQRRERAAMTRLVNRRPDFVHDTADDEIHRSTMEEALRRLADRLRVPVILRYYLDFSELEVARALSIRSGTVKSRLHEARRLLAEDSAVLAAHEERAN